LVCYIKGRTQIQSNYGQLRRIFGPNVREMKGQDAGENCIMRTCINVVLFNRYKSIVRIVMPRRTGWRECSTHGSDEKMRAKF
jgi:hypothetical protein